MTASRRHFLFAFAATAPLFLLSALPALSESGDTPADIASQRSRNDELLIIDVRSPLEWQQSGIPQGALPVTIHGPEGMAGFVAAVRRELGGEINRPIALICARGQRSTKAQAALADAGFTQVLNIREGVLGSSSGPGWLARELPMEACSSC